MGPRSPGLRREESRRTLEDVDVLAQPAVLTPQSRQFLAFAAGQTVTFTGVYLGLADPVADRGLGQLEVLTVIMVTPTTHGTGKPAPGDRQCDDHHVTAEVPSDDAYHTERITNRHHPAATQGPE